MAEINFPTVVLGAAGFTEGNVNETYRGQVLLHGGEIRQAIIKDLDLLQLQAQKATLEEVFRKLTSPAQSATAK